MNQLMAEMQADGAKGPSKTDLKKVTTLAKHALKLEAQIEKKAEEVATLEKQLRHITDVEIPASMEEIGVKDFGLQTGHRVEVEQKIRAGLTGKYKEPAMKWLRKAGHRAMITNTLTVEIPKGKDAKARGVAAELKKQGFPARRSTDIHTGAFKALIKRELEAGKSVPLEEIGIHLWTTTKFIRPSD